MTALWRHDCTKCHYVGSSKIRGKTHDFYFCPNEWYKGSVIARYSSDGPGYESMPYNSCGLSPMTIPLKTAFQFVLNSGLTKEELDG